MPAVRELIKEDYTFKYTSTGMKKMATVHIDETRNGVATFASKPKPIWYPQSAEEREAYRTKAGKRLTPHQWNVYDFTLTIPVGKVTTYKEVATAVGGSPRSVGSALRNNPFSPYVPCHRVIATNLFLGGYFGEWGKDHKTGTQFNHKLDLLSKEGVEFSKRGYLSDPERVIVETRPTDI